MKLSDDAISWLEKEIAAHNECGHNDMPHCMRLIISGVAFKLDLEEIPDEFIEACRNYVADFTLRNLILKGFVEVTGMEGDEMTYGVTEAGQQVITIIQEEE